MQTFLNQEWPLYSQDRGFKQIWGKARITKLSEVISKGILLDKVQFEKLKSKIQLCQYFQLQHMIEKPAINLALKSMKTNF